MTIGPTQRPGVGNAEHDHGQNGFVYRVKNSELRQSLVLSPCCQKHMITSLDYVDNYQCPKCNTWYFIQDHIKICPTCGATTFHEREFVKLKFQGYFGGARNSDTS